MAGLNLRTGFRASAAATTGVPNTGTVESAAFMPGATQSPQTAGQALSPGSPPGLTFWVGAGALVALALIRHSLPN
jgi:hypothetical protein